MYGLQLNAMLQLEVTPEKLTTEKSLNIKSLMKIPNDKLQKMTNTRSFVQNEQTRFKWFMNQQSRN